MMRPKEAFFLFKSVKHGVRVKVRYIEGKKDKSPEARGRWDNLRKAGKKQARQRLIRTNNPLYVINLGAEWQAPRRQKHKKPKD